LVDYIRKVEDWREPIRFAVIADPEIAIIPPGRTLEDYPYIDVGRGGKMHRESVELFTEAVRIVNAVGDLDFVLIPADLTADAERYNHEKLLELLPKIDFPTYVTVGNHDTRAFAREDIWSGVPTISPEADLVNYPELPLLYRDYWGPGGKLYYSIEVAPGVRLITLFAFPYHHCPDEQFFRWEVGEEQRTWLESELGKAQRNSEFVIVMYHWPIVSHNIPFWDKEGFPLLWSVAGRGFQTEDELQVRSILEVFDVPLVLSGSFHIQDIMEKNGVWHITTGSPISHPTVGARFFELDRERGLLHITTHHIDDIPIHPGFAEYSRRAFLEYLEEKAGLILDKNLPPIAKPLTEPLKEALLLAIRVEPGVLFWRRRGAEESVFDNLPQIEDPQMAWLLERVLTIGENTAINRPEDDNAVLPVRVTGGKVRQEVEGRIRTGELPPIYDLTLGGRLSFGYLGAGRDAARPTGHFFLDEFILAPEVVFAARGISLMAELGFREDDVRVDKFMVYFGALPYEPQIDEIRRIITLLTGWEFEVDSRISLGLCERLVSPERKEAVPSLLERAIWEGEAFRVALESKLHFLRGGISIGEGLQLGTRGVGIDDRFGMLYDARNAGRKGGHPELGIELGIRGDAVKISRFIFRGELSDADIGVLTRELPGYISPRRDMRRHGMRMIHNYNGLTLKGNVAWMKDGLLEREGWSVCAAREMEIGRQYLRSLTSFLRYEALKVGWQKSVTHPASWDRERLALGFTLGIRENINLTVEHHRNDETTGGGSVANDEFLTQLVFEF
jgi:hypothetical protein